MRVSLQTLIDRSVKNMGTGIHPVVKESAIELIKRAYSEGINVQISSGYRSAAEQNALYAQGRTKPGNVVTNARAGESNHNYGLAIDYFLVSEDGNTAIWSVNQDWRKVAQIGKALGFAWGGDWTSFPDYPHLEMMGGLSISQLKAGKKPNLVSRVVSAATIEIEKETEEDEMKPFVAANKTLDNSIRTVLARFEAKEGGLGKEWRKKYEEGTLTEAEATQILYHAVFNGWITGKLEG
jgi:peptidoglycan LD-endopeptidase CwlK